MKKVTIVLSSLMLVLLLAACGSSAEVDSSAPTEEARLNDEYADALLVPAQLALGSLNLEGTQLTIDAAQAAGLLPLWQVYQSMSGSETAATAELTAMLNQLQDTMTAEQIAAITAMKLTAEDTTAWMEKTGQEIGVGGKWGGGEPPAGGGERTGGAPGGGPGGGAPGIGTGQPSDDTRATRAAELGGSEDDLTAAFMNRALVGALIQSLQGKTGELD
ncbi:MAG: hypothetical protein GQ526_11755 [Ardenticatenales bacterium]|nr:hypothetical protein [Ardenticatenales bacterium]